MKRGGVSQCNNGPRTCWRSGVSKPYLQVSVQHLLGVQTLDGLGHLYEHQPNLVLWKQSFLLCLVTNCLVEVPIVCQLHYNAELGALGVEEGFLVGDHVGMVDGRQNAHLVEGVPLFLRF